MNIKDFLDFVDFIKNVDKYEARVQALKDENDRLEANIRLTSEVSEIAYTKERTDQLFEQAKKELDAAKITAADVKEKAKTSFDKKLADLVARETDVREKQADAYAKLKQAEDLNIKLNETLKTQVASLEAKEAELDKTQKEVNIRLAKLKSVME